MADVHLDAAGISCQVFLSHLWETALEPGEVSQSVPVAQVSPVVTAKPPRSGKVYEPLNTGKPCLVRAFNCPTTEKLVMLEMEKRPE